MPPKFYRGKPLKRSKDPPKWTWLEPLSAYEEMVLPSPPTLNAESPPERVEPAQPAESEEDDDCIFVREVVSTGNSGTAEQENATELSNAVQKSRLKWSAGAAALHRNFGEPVADNEAKMVLRTWMNNHLDFPYPTDEELAELEKESGFTSSQIMDWLNRLRRLEGTTIERMQTKASNPMTLPESARLVLREWIHNNVDRPYPTRQEKEDLTREADCEMRQLTTFFSQFRYYILGPNAHNPWYDTRCRCCGKPLEPN